MAIGRKKNDYFQMFSDNLKFSRQCLEYLKGVMHDFNHDAETLEIQMMEIHKIEHAADISKHVMMEHLAKEFITPIEREDIIEIAKNLDDITDQIEDVLQQIYIYGVEEIRPDSLDFLDVLEKCLNELEHIFKEFKNFKKSSTIHQSVIDLNRYEEVADDLYIAAMRNLFNEKNQGDPINVFSWSKIYLQLEKCCDTCEETGNLVEEVIMKNS